MIVDPSNQFFHCIEPTPINKLPGSYWVQHERGRKMWVYASQHIPDVFAPVFLSQTEIVGSGANAAEHAHDAVFWLETMLNVKRSPGASLFILRKGNAVISVVVPLRA